VSVPTRLIEIVEHFADQRDALRSGNYNETQVRREFIDPLFTLLGWDVDNRGMAPQDYKEVVHEDAIKVGGAHRAPDYSFRIGGSRQFFVEAKKPVVNLKDDPTPAFQLRRYAWSANLPLSILTDFEEFAVYDCRFRPNLNDKASTSRYLFLRYENYPERWDEISSLFSKQAVINGSLKRFSAAATGVRGTTTVDAAFLRDIESWRGALARNFAKRNSGLTQRQLSYAVQMTIDRIIFLRIAEDRGIEGYGRLHELTNGAEIYEALLVLFQRADERYNSGLFHFQVEKDRTEEPDDLTPKLRLDDEPLRKAIQSLYYPQSPYEFSVLPVDVLGQVYEQFLGKVIRLTSNDQVEIEEKPAVRKAGGVFYTPTYVVDFIVERTLTPLLASKKAGPRGGASKLKIIDPACGSGSFLIGAYQFLIDWHRNQYLREGPEKHKKELYQGPGGEWRLTTAEKKRILLNNIYGVDIDAQAVEVTKLALLLKVLEGESAQSLVTQLTLFHERALPDLGKNIKWGNSLIGPDFYNQAHLRFADAEERIRINPFYWQSEFPDVFQVRNPWFDAIIGNPPWGADFSEDELRYLRSKYSRVVERMIDSYIYFLDLATRISKEGAPIGFVVPGTILNQVDARAVRDLMLSRGLTAVVNLGQGVFGRKVQNTAAVLVSMSRPETDGRITLDDLSAFPPELRKTALLQVGQSKWREWSDLVRRDPHLTFFVGQLQAIALLDRLRQRHPPLGAAIEGAIQRGVSPDVVTAHVVTREQIEAEELETDVIRPSISGSQIKRYCPWESDQFIIYTSRSTPIDKYPNILKHLERFRHLNTCKEVVEGKHPWWTLHRP
jgi:hypothetical protein